MCDCRSYRQVYVEHPSSPITEGRAVECHFALSPRAAPALGLRAWWSERRRLRPTEGASAGQAGAFRPHSRLAAGFALELRRHRRDPPPRRAVASLCVVQWREWRGRQRTRRRSRHGHGPTIGSGRALGEGSGECDHPSVPVKSTWRSVKSTLCT